jgi:hypothetical protein
MFELSRLLYIEPNVQDGKTIHSLFSSSGNFAILTAIRRASSLSSLLPARNSAVGGAGCTWGRTASEPGKSFAPFPRVCGSSFLLYEAQIADDGKQPLSGRRFGGAGKIKKRIEFILVPIHLR